MQDKTFPSPHAQPRIMHPPSPLLRTVLRLASFLLASASALAQLPEPSPIPATLRSDFNLDPFYQQAVVLEGFPIVASQRVSTHALREATWIVQHMLVGRSDLLHAMASNRVRLAVMAWNEFTTDIPEHAHLQPKVYWDRRARGLGATPNAPAVSCGEENLLGHPNDPYSTENILIHEFAHAIHKTGLNSIDPTFDSRLSQTFHSATNRGLWKGTYAAVNHHEYWAECVQSWFDNNRENDALHNHVNTRAELRAYDPPAAALCQEVFGDRPWRYLKPDQRPEPDRRHLAGLKPDSLPRFQWRAAPIGEKPRVALHTALGEIEIELDAVRAPIASANFLRYVHEGFYNDGHFFSTVRTDNQPDDPVRIQILQAEANPARHPETFPPIPLERTRDTGLRHLVGTVSMDRKTTDSATHHFFICLEDLPDLDFAGRRNPDGQGFAAFGRVIKGMEIVQQIHASPSKAQKLDPPIRIQRAIRIH